MVTRLRIATSGTMPATAEDIGGVGGIGQILGRIANAIPGMADDVGWITPVPLAVAAPVNVSRSAALVGIAGSSARADHKHDVDTGVPTQVVPGQAALQGAGPGLALSDHQHAMDAFAVPVSVGSVNFQGLLDTFARSDHVHALLASAIPSAYAANWAEPDWYIDGTVGSDANNGTTALTPLQTGAELLRRLGPYAMWRQSVTIHVLANGMADALILRGILLLSSTHLDIVGTPLLLANAGTVATYTGINHATPVAPQVSTTLIADWTGYQWKRLRCTAGAAGSIGAVTWVALANPAGAGLNIARTPRWSRPKVTTTPVYEMVNPAVGDTIVVESVPSIPAITLLLDGPVPTAKSPLYANRQWSIDSIACQQISLGGTALATWGLSYIFGSVVNSIQQIGQLWVAASAEPKVGCLVDNQDTSGSTIGSSNFVGLWQACLFGKGSTTAFTYSNQQSQYNTCVFQGCKITVNSYGYASLFDVQLFDIVGATTPTISVSWGGNCQISSASGSGNAGYGVRVFQNCYIGLSVAGTFNIVAAVSTFRIDDAPAFNLTLAQFRQASDYAQKGITPAMVAGTTTVTVPWYDNTTQRVQVTHAAFAGTPGILSVQQISTTQFVVTSSNALDTSTVNWTISPLGRNIFVSTL